MTLKSDDVLDPALRDLLTSLKAEVMKTMKCMMPGEIKSFDKTKKTATIQLLLKRSLPNDTVQSYPLLIDCPVFTPQGGGASLRFPIAAGDNCMVVFADRNVDVWFKTGAEGVPFNGRVHDISDGFALVGINALTSTLPDYKDDEAELEYGGAKVGLKGSRIKLGNEATDLLTAISGLIDVIAAVQTTTSIPLSAASISALQAQKLVFQGFLYP